MTTFDLIVATVGPAERLGRLLDSLARQSHTSFRVLVVDQNADDRLGDVLASAAELDLFRLRSAPGLARARNAALERVQADVVAFPDDDCEYAPDLLARVAARLEGDRIDGVLGRTAHTCGATSPNWPTQPLVVTPRIVWHCSNSNTLFLTRSLVEDIGCFDESLGLGAGTPWTSGEETEYLVRALRLGARLEFDPTLVVTHADRPQTAELGRRDGASVGYILGKHRFPPRTLARMAVRPIGGALVSIARLDGAGALFHAATARGRARGYLGGRRAR